MSKLKRKYLIMINIFLLLNFSRRLNQAKLATKDDIVDFEIKDILMKKMY